MSLKIDSHLNRSDVTSSIKQKFVMILDDDELFRRLTESQLRRQGYQVSAFERSEELLQTRPPGRLGCVIMDLKLPGINGRQAFRELIAAKWQLPIIFVSAFATIPTVVDLMKSGAVDFLEKPVEDVRLLRSVERAMRLAELGMKRQTEAQSAMRSVRSLTEREKEVLTQVVSGRMNKQIACELGISERTVKAHRANIMEKVGVDSVARLVPVALQAGIMPLPMPD